MEWEQSKAVVPASSNFRRRTAVRGQELGGGRPQCDTRLGRGVRLLAHKAAPYLVTATSGQAAPPRPGPAPGKLLPRAPGPSAHDPSVSHPSPPPGQLSLGAEGTQTRTKGDSGSPAPPRAPPPPTQPSCVPGAPRAKPAPRRATHLHSSGNSEPWARAAPGAQTSSSSCSRSRELSGRPAGAGPRWALRPAAAPITLGPGCAASAGLAARGCRGPRPGHGRAARAEAKLEAERRRRAQEERERSRSVRGARLGWARRRWPRNRVT